MFQKDVVICWQGEAYRALVKTKGLQYQICDPFIFQYLGRILGVSVHFVTIGKGALELLLSLLPSDLGFKNDILTRAGFEPVTSGVECRHFTN